MEADPLYHVKQLFHQALLTPATIAEASSQTLTPGDEPAALPRAVYVARAHLALQPAQVVEAQAVLAPFLAVEPAPPSARAASALATYLSSSGAERAAAVDEVRDLVLEVEGDDVEADVEGPTRVLAGTIFILEKENEEAVATLTEGAAKSDLECIALLTQLLLALDRRDLAQQQYAAAKRIGNDSTLVQAIEAWIGLKTGARPLHQAYYFYEELYQLPAGRTPPVLASHAAAHLLLSHVDEAKADVQEAQGRDGGADDANVLAVATSLGDDEAAAKLATTGHPFAADLAAKDKAFDEAAAKFAIAA
ncbi:hypothetical protein VHUM_00365 [Vanrija humicola]|uniref:Coatomer subunit epsilon n=1 Tax=Vanrija humicola TaxID=5417 RepID=A0A7D8Z773_VANHU|nr:hypothetical protein VHUM_00365 [Vanrija humicola]